MIIGTTATSNITLSILKRKALPNAWLPVNSYDSYSIMNNCLELPDLT